MFVGTEAEVWEYDGGDGDDPDTDEPSYATGAMWQVDEDFAGRIPIGVGTPEAWGSALVQGTNYGTSKVQLTESILPAHDHHVARSTQANGSGKALTYREVLAVMAAHREGAPWAQHQREVLLWGKYLWKRYAHS